MSSIRDQWLKHRPVGRLGLINQKLVIPAFSQACGEIRSSLKFTPSFGQTLNLVSPDFVNAATFEAWIKLPFIPLVDRYPIFTRTIAGGADRPQYDFSIDLGKLYFAATKGGVINAIPDVRLVPQGVWFHGAIVWNGVNVKFYLNGEEYVGTNLAAPVDALGAGTQQMGFDPFSSFQFQGNLNELRVWNVARTKEQIINSMFAPRDYIDANNVDDSLHIYAKCRRILDQLGVKTTINYAPSGPNILQLPLGTVLDDTDAAPIKYGASSIIISYEVDIERKCSFKFPIVINNPDHSLVVRWEDENNIIQRRYFYKPVGVDYDNTITQYLGEAVGHPFVLEVWNIDGEDLVTLEDDLTIRLSTTTIPVDVTDIASIEADTITADTTLAEPFPLVFPLQFNTQKTYSI